jgi:hypothetical protein
MASKHIVNCPCCFQVFKKKGCYEKHILYCQQSFANNNTDCREPSTRQLYEMINTLMEKYNTVQNELESLKRHINVKNKRLDVLNWLNEQPVPITTWSRCMDNFTISLDDMDYIFKNGFIDGLIAIINNYLYREENRKLLKCFDQKKNILYVFDEQWKELKMDEFKVIFNDIYKKTLSAFDEYKNVNQHRMTDEDFQTEYSNNFMKLLCVNLTNDTKCTRIKNKIYAEFKENFKTIVEMDI